MFPIPTLLCMVGTGLTAVYFLILVNRAFFGRLPETLANFAPCAVARSLPSAIVTVLIIALGLQPNWMLRWSEATTTALAPIAQRVAFEVSVK